MTDVYDGSNIKILTDEQQLSFDFKLVDSLAEEYKKDKGYISRSVEACRLAGVDPREYFVERYLKGNKTIPENKDVTEISKELQKEMNHKK